MKEESKMFICRVCLADAKAVPVVSADLQSLYEKLTTYKLKSGDGRPESMCYICYALLERCWKFQNISRTAEKLLTELLQNGTEINQKSFTALKGVLPITLVFSPLKLESMSAYVKDESLERAIKVEAENSADVSLKNGDPVTDFLDYNSRKKLNIPKQEEYACEYEIHNKNTSDADSPIQKHKPERNIKNTSKARKKTKTLYKSLPNINQKTLTCKMCSKVFKRNSYIKQHMKTHNDVNPFTCNKCVKSFLNKHDLQKRALVHTSLHICDNCGKTFTSKYSLKFHIAHKHMKIHAAVKTYNCDRCDKTFNHRGTLRLHMRIHTGDKPYACDNCSKTFSQKGSLERHFRVHTGEKPYACDKCCKTFNQEGSLKRHIKMHTGEKPYACDRCGKAYYESSHLKRHIRTHTGEKPYACDRCFQTFAQISNLQAHMKKHTGEKATNYVCYECNKTFDHKSIFRRHILKHTQEKPYPCERCEKKYADKRSLQRHIISHN